MAIAILIEGVRKQFRDTVAVRDLDLRIEQGSLCGFLGPNGAGKSTTIRMIMSIIQPDAGRVEVLGGSALDAKDRIGYLPEERGLYRKMRVGEFLAYIGKLKGVPKRIAHARAHAWLERLELPQVFAKRCQELSKGMQQKVQFVAAVIHGPELLILDEPFSGLDPVNARLMSGVVRDISDTGATILFSTHQMIHAEQLCDRVVLIDKGSKILDASLDEIRSRFDPRSVQIELVPGSVNGAAEAAERAFLGIAGVEGVEWMAERRAARLRLGRGVDGRSVMTAALAAAPLRSVELSRVTLDDVFVELVGGDAQPSTAEGGSGGD